MSAPRTRTVVFVLGSFVEVLVNGERQIRLTLAERRPAPGGGTVDIVTSQMAIPADMLDALREVCDGVGATLAHVEAGTA